MVVPQNKQLKYKVLGFSKDKIVNPGETVSFQYSISAVDSLTEEELLNINESAKSELVLKTVLIDNPETTDYIYYVVGALIVSGGLFVFFRNKKILYGCFSVFLIGLCLMNVNRVMADDEELIKISTNIKYILSNLAPSCANLDYEGDFCIDWKQYVSRDKVNYLIMTDMKDMKDTYNVGDVSFTLQTTHDVSEQQNTDVILGIYKDDLADSYLYLIGQDGGVIVSKDASYQFTSYDSVNNKNEYDFHYVKYLDFSKFYSNKTINMEYMLTGIGTKANMEYHNLDGFETSNVVNMKGMFSGFGEATKNLKIDVSSFDTSNVTDMSWMFWEFGYNSETVDLDLSTFDTGNVTDMNHMFYLFAGKATNLNLDIYDWNTSNVENMSYMFFDFNSTSNTAIKVDYFKEWDTSNLLNMESMFGVNMFNAISNTTRENVIDLTGLDTENVKSMKDLFAFNIIAKEIIIPDTFKTDSVVDMSGMFYLASTVEDLNVSHFNTSNVTNMSEMFMAVLATSLDLSSWDVSKVKDISYMFSNADVKNLNLSNWKLDSLEKCRRTFYLMPNITYLDLSTVDFSKSTDYREMFMGFNGYSFPAVFDLSGSDWNEEADANKMFDVISGSTIYVKDEKAKLFIEAHAPDCTVIIKE